MQLIYIYEDYKDPEDKDPARQHRISVSVNSTEEAKKIYDEAKKKIEAEKGKIISAVAAP